MVIETIRKHFLFVSLFSLITLVGSFPTLEAGAAESSINGRILAYPFGSTRTLERIKADAKADPDYLYHKVWRLIKEDYFESTYNGQDWDIWEHRYDGKLKTTDDAHKAIETMLASLGDRYTRFLDNDAFDDEKNQIDAKLCGIGIQIGLDKVSKIIIIAPIDDTPAQRAGLTSADEILEIDGKPTKGFSVEEAAKHIRGEINTKVVLTIQRHNHRFKVAVVRAEIPIKAVQTVKMLDGDIGYIRLSSFISQQANREMRDAIYKLAPAKGLILDLRENPGGLLTNAIEIANMFLDHGNIVSTVDRDGYKTAQTADGNQLCKKPLCILINKGSASASEITSGALKDNGRAILVGTKTFGKGLVQGINKLEDGSGVNITIARYLTPADVDINKKGIAPDQVVDLSEDDLKTGKGCWWNDPAGPQTKRQPEDFKDKQLKAAFDLLKNKVAHSASVAIGHP
ncbi:MAG: S41 family peptidase [Candidatus Melainabacteria bacterium]|jgi:carboxyl-terminal processing protease|nr:S41 family peptidase [Candidatus Melainabacteria bacterium]